MRKFNDYVKQNRKRQGNVRKTVSGKYKICKKDNGKHRVFGYAIIGNGEKEIESQLGYSVSAKDFELAIYEFIRNMPTNDMSNPVRIIESCVFTKEKQQAIGIPIGILPPLAYWIGLEIYDKSIWEMIKSSEFPVFAIEIAGSNHHFSQYINSIFPVLHRLLKVSVPRFRFQSCHNIRAESLSFPTDSMRHISV